MVKSDLCDVPVEGVVSVENVCGGTVNVGVGVDVVEEGGGAAPVSCDVGGLRVELVRISRDVTSFVFKVTDIVTGELWSDDGRRSGQFGGNTFFLDKAQMGDYVENSWVRFEKIDNGVIPVNGQSGSGSSSGVNGAFSGEWYAVGTHVMADGVVTTGVRVTYHDPLSDEGDEVYDLVVGVPPFTVNGGGAVVNADKCIHLPSGNIYLQINKLDSVNGWIGYTIHYDNGTSYELIDGMIQKRGSPYKFYWVEDTTTPSAATYEVPYVSFDEIIINETTIPVDSYTHYDNSSQQFMVYVDFKSYIELYNDVRLKVSVQYPNSEEKEYLYF